MLIVVNFNQFYTYITVLQGVKYFPAAYLTARTKRSQAYLIFTRVDTKLNVIFSRRFFIPMQYFLVLLTLPIINPVIYFINS